MNVVHVATSLSGGAGIGLWRYHQALRIVGVNSRILVPQNPRGPDADISAFTWSKRSLPRRTLMRLGWDTRREARLRRELSALDRRSPAPPAYELFSLPLSDYRPESHPWIAEADLVNVHWVCGALDWPRFFNTVRVPVVFTLHDQHPYLGGFHYSLDAANNPHLAAFDNKIRRIKQRTLAGRRVGVVGNSDWNTCAARESGFYAPDTAFETVYYPLDTKVFAPRPRAAAKVAAGVPAHRLVVGFACENLSNKRKGFDLLLDALEHLPPVLREQIVLLSFGRESSSELKERVKLPWIHLGFLETDEAKVAAYTAMDVFVAPSRAEAFGLTALEAEAVGVPVVASAVGGLREAVPAAIATAPRSLAEDMSALLTDASLYAHRVEDGRRLAVERHAPPLIGRQLAAFYQRLAA